MNYEGDQVRHRKKVDELSEPAIDDTYGAPTKASPLRSTAGCKTLARWVVSSVLLLLTLITLYLLLTTSPVDPIVISLPLPPKWVGPLEHNDRLQHALHKFSGQLIGPESIAQDPTGHYLYTGTADGKIMEIYDGKLREVTRLGKPPCGTDADEPTCGRPLGMKFDPQGFLIIADAYLGLYQVNVVAGDTTQLMSSQRLQSRFLNDMDISRSGMIYVTDSSLKWSRRHFMYCALEGRPTGRLLEINPETEEVKVLLSNLNFANGVVLSYKEDYILVAETLLARIQRLWLKGDKKGQVDIFANNLPGLPDNIRRSGRGTYWVAMATTRKADKFSMFDFTASRPWLRKLVAKVVSQEALKNLFLSKEGLIVELDKEGRIVQSLQDPTGKVVKAASEVEEKDGTIYIGSYVNSHLSTLNLKQEERKFG